MSSPNADTRQWSRARFAVIDVEGNGAHPPDLVEIAIVLVIAGRPQPARTWLVKPPAAITWRAKSIHQISNADVADAPPVADIEADVVAVLAGADIVVGHQVWVDVDVITRSCPSWAPLPALDTLRLARSQYPDLPSHKLGDLVQEFDLDPADGHAHRAGHDTTVTARLLLHLIAWMTQPVTVAELLRRGAWPAEPASSDQGELDLTNL